VSELTQELNEIRTLAREFAAAELRPHVERWDHDAQLDDAVIAQAAELGFLGMLLPEERGGMGFDRVTWAAAVEELAWGEPAVALTLVFHARVARLLEQHGSDALRGRWLEALAAGSATACLAVAEAEADELHTTATRAGDGWRIRGQKRWVSGARPGGAMLLLARAPAGATLFLVPVDDVASGARDATLGLRPLDVRTIGLDVQVGDDARLGAEGQGGALLGEDVLLACLGTAAVGVGIAQAALEHAVRYADEREQFGERLRAFDGIRFKLADMATATAAARALLEHAARTDDVAAARMAKVCAATTAMRVATEAVQIFGGYGYMRDYPVEKLMRDGRAVSLLGGADELHRLAIADALYPE
jgi:alkylation response protein AidB-like acyl-CoA dehydrogenase